MSTTVTLPSSSHAVSRSSELLSCAKTALKIELSQQDADAMRPIIELSPQQLSLHDSTRENSSDAEMTLVLEDGLALLRQMKSCLNTLSSLVKRRGHTNDPTGEMQGPLDDFQTAATTLSEIHVIPTPLISQQQARHYQFISAWLQGAANVYTNELQQILKLRAQVLQDLTIKRQALLNGTTNTTRNKNSFQSAMNSPLFTAVSNQSTTKSGMGATTRMPPPNAPNAAPTRSSSFPTNGTTSSAVVGYGGTPTTSRTTSGYYASSSSYGGGGASSYGGVTHNHANTATGMRQRKATNANATTNNNNHDTNMQVQQQELQQRRDTRNRLHQARQAESKLAELGTLFGKMSSLISQQGEVLEKVEDDVEAALLDVGAGEQEIQTLYSIKRGNRGLILKVFGILIFLILFMRFY